MIEIVIIWFLVAIFAVFDAVITEVRTLDQGDGWE